MNRSWCLSEQQFATQTIHTDLRRTLFQLTILSRRFVTEICSGGDRVTTSKYNSIIEFRSRDEQVDHPRGCCYYVRSTLLDVRIAPIGPSGLSGDTLRCDPHLSYFVLLFLLLSLRRSRSSSFSPLVFLHFLLAVHYHGSGAFPGYGHHSSETLW